MIKLIFKAYKKTEKNIFIYIYKKWQITIIKKKKKKLSKKSCERSKNPSEEEKGKKRRWSRER